MVQVEVRRDSASIIEEKLRIMPKVQMFGFSTSENSYHTGNEDTILYSPEYRFAAVFDGVGGVKKGALASQTASKFLAQELKIDLGELVARENAKRGHQYDDGSGWMGLALAIASSEVIAQTGGEGRTTASVVKFWTGEDSLVHMGWASIGDSRIYVLRSTGVLKQVSADDNMLSLLIEDHADQQAIERLKEISRHLDEVADESRLWRIRIKGGRTKWGITPRQPWAVDVFPDRGDAEGSLLHYMYFYRNRVMKVLGQGGVEPNDWNLGVEVLAPGDRVILTTDGVHDNLTRRNIRTIVKKDTKDPAKALVKAALKRSKSEHFRAKRDDMSAVVIDVKEPSPLILADPKDIRGPVTIPYAGRSMTCLGRSKKNGAHDPDCQVRVADAQREAKRVLITVFQSAIIGKL